MQHPNSSKYGSMKRSAAACSHSARAAPLLQFKVDAKTAKALRDKTGAGMMDAKKALMETGGDLEKAMEYLRKKGLASADKKSGRVAAEGVIASYIHAGSRCCTGIMHVWIQSLCHFPQKPLPPPRKFRN